MIVHCIELTYVGPFRGTVRIGPLAPGINVLSAPNESGKSTALRATARALFDKHTTKGEEIKSLQPAGTDLAPKIVVEFETRRGRFRIEKTFLQPRCLLKQWETNAWQVIAEADSADQKMQELLQSSLPGRGATKPENWGLLGFLWARQGEPADWPKLDDEAVGQKIRARLARVQLDPVIETLRGRLAALADSVITSTGQAKTGGALRQAEDDLVAIDAELTKLRQTRTDLESKHQRFHQLNAQVDQREKEAQSLSEDAQNSAKLAASAAELVADLKVKELELTGARERLAELTTDLSVAAQREAELTAAGTKLTTAVAAETRAKSALAVLQSKLLALEALRPDKEEQINRLRVDHTRIKDLMEIRKVAARVSALAGQVAKATATAAGITGLRDQRSKLPGVSGPKQAKLESLRDQVRELSAQVRALGLTVEIAPDENATVGVMVNGSLQEQSLPAKESALLHSPDVMDLRLAGWGKILIRSGAKEAKTLAQDLAAAESNLRAALIESGVKSVEEGREVLAQRKELDAQVLAAESTLANILGAQGKLADLVEAATTAQRRLESLTTALNPTAAEAQSSDTFLESEDARYSVAIPAAEAELKTLAKNVDQDRAAERTANAEIEKISRAVAEIRQQAGTLESKLADMRAKHPAGFDVAKIKAQIAFGEAEARVAVIRGKLPPDFERLPDRNRRTAAALQQVQSELQAMRSERDGAKGSLETLGGLGLYSLETELEERKVEAEKRRDAARAKGWGARIAGDLIAYRKQAATKAVLAPLEQRLSAAFAQLTGDFSRNVFLDDQLQLAGVGRTREDAYAFDLLSQGAKEQLLLCLRVAVAQELAASEPQVLILDDVLVNTDPVRQGRILDTLEALAKSLQIIIITCHPERYRGVGVSTTLTPIQ